MYGDVCLGSSGPPLCPFLPLIIVCCVQRVMSEQRVAETLIPLHRLMIHPRRLM